MKKLAIASLLALPVLMLSQGTASAWCLHCHKIPICMPLPQIPIPMPCFKFYCEGCPEGGCHDCCGHGCGDGFFQHSFYHRYPVRPDAGSYAPAPTAAQVPWYNQWPQGMQAGYAGYSPYYTGAPGPAPSMPYHGAGYAPVAPSVPSNPTAMDTPAYWYGR